MKIKSYGAYNDASSNIKSSGAYAAVSSLIKSGGGYLAAGGETPPVGGDVVLTLSGGGLGAAPTIYGGNLRGGTAGTQIAIGAGTPWSHTGGDGAPDYVSDGRGGTWMDAGGSASGSERGDLYCVFPRSGKVGVFIKQSIKSGGLFNGAATPNTVATASSTKPIWLKDGDSGGNAGLCDLVINSHTGSGICAMSGNSSQFSAGVPRYPDAFDFAGPTNTLVAVDFGADKASAALEYIMINKHLGAHEGATVGDTATDTPAVRSVDRFQLNGFGLAGDLLIGAAYAVTGGDHKIAILAGNMPHLDQCTDVEFIKPQAWADGQITLSPADIPAGYNWIYVRDRAGNWFSAPAAGGALVSGRGTKAQYTTPDPATLTSYVKLTTADGRMRRDFAAPWSPAMGNAYEIDIICRFSDLTTNKYMVGGLTTDRDFVNINTTGVLQARLGNGATATVGSVSGIITPGQKGRLRLAWAAGSLTATWTPQGGSQATIGTILLAQTAAVEIDSVLRGNGAYPANMDVYAVVMRDIGNPNNTVALPFRPPIDGRASKDVYDINGNKNANQGGGSNFYALGTATPTNNGVWASE